MDRTFWRRKRVLTIRNGALVKEEKRREEETATRLV
jgi:hypothetical protein